MAVLNPSAHDDRARRHARRRRSPAPASTSIKASRSSSRRRSARDASTSTARVTELVGYAEQARRDGLLALDEQLADDRGPVHQEGPAARRRRHRPRARRRRPRGRERRACASATRPAAQPFEKAGGYAPTMGIIGTVFGLVHVLANLDAAGDARPVDLVARSSRRCSASRSANVIYLPIAARLQAALRGGAARPRDDARGHPRRSRPATTRASSPRSSSPSSRRRSASTRGRGRAAAQPPQKAPRSPSCRGARRHRRAAPRGGARERGALARVLRRHDDAAVLPLHGAVLDLVGEHVEVRGAAEGAPGRLLRARSSPAARRHADRQRQAARASRAPSRRCRRCRRSTRSNDTSSSSSAQRRGSRQGAGPGLQAAQAPHRRPGREGTGLAGKVETTVRAAAWSSSCSPTRSSSTRARRRSSRRRADLLDKIGDVLARRAHAPDRRRGPHRLAADLHRRATRRNWELSGARASAVVAHLRRRRRARGRLSGARLRRRGPDRHATRPPKGARATAASRSSSPASSNHRSHTP